MSRRWAALGGTTMAMLGVALLIGGVAMADPSSPFDELRRLEQRAEHHRIAARRLNRTIERWKATFRGNFQKGRLAKRAIGRLENEVARRLVRWEKIHRRIERRQYRWGPGEGRDLARLLDEPEVASLQRQRQTFQALGRLKNNAPQPAIVMRERARMSVDLAQHRASEQVAETERKRLVDETKAERRNAEIEAAMRRAQMRLERSLQQFIEHETGRDFHRRKGTLLPPVEAEPAVGYGHKKQSDSASYVRHTGLTYRVEVGTRVQSVAGGLVVFAKRFEGYGRLVIVDHGDDYHSLYAHLADISVDVGDEIARGAEIGTSGASGSFEGAKLYVELRHKDEPIDPSPWFVRREVD